MNEILPSIEHGRIVTTPQLSDFFREFLTSLEVKGRVRPLTIHRYRDTLRRFLDFTGDMGLYDLSVGVVEAFQKHLADSSSSPKSVVPHLSCLRSFIGWLERRGIRPPLYKTQIELPRIRRTLRDIPTDEEVNKLVRCFAADRKATRRDKSILLVLITSGVRVSELTALTRNDVNLDNCSMKITGKGGYERLAFFSPGAGEYLGKYLADRKDDYPFLFIQQDKGQQGKPLTSRSIQRLILKYESLAEIGHYGVHGYRHKFATYALDRGLDLFQVSQLLGHQSIATTQIYLHVSNRRLQKAHRDVFKRFTFRDR